MTEEVCERLDLSRNQDALAYSFYGNPVEDSKNPFTRKLALHKRFERLQIHQTKSVGARTEQPLLEKGLRSERSST